MPLEQHLPIGNSMWDAVFNEFEKVFLNTERDVKSICNLCHHLIGSKMPTGDLNFPWDAQKAKQIQKMIHSTKAIGDVSEENAGPQQMMAGIAANRVANSDADEEEED